MRRAGLRFILMLSFLPLQTFSQQVFEHITTANGLSNNVVNAVLQDREGFYWIATVDGLNRFDGSAFKIFRNERDNPHSLSHNLCINLIEDDESNIWVATYNGVSVFKRKEGRFENIFLQHPGFNPDILNRITAMIKDDQGNIWIGSQALWKYDTHTSKLQYYSNDPADPQSMSDNSGIASLAFDKRNNGIWIRTINNLNFFDRSTQHFFNKKNNPRNWKVLDIETSGKLAIDESRNRLWFYETSYKGYSYFEFASGLITRTPIRHHINPRTILSDSRGRLWISYWQDDEKSIIFDPISGTVDSNFLIPFHSRSALAPRFNDVYTDKFDNLWVSSGNGISVFNLYSQYFDLYELSPPPGENNSNPLHIMSVASAGPEGFWVGCNRKGLYQFDRKTRILKKILHPLIDEMVASLFADGDSILWLGTSTRIYKIQCRTGRIINKTTLSKIIQFISKDGNGNIWVGDWNDGLYRLDNNGNVLKHYIHEDSDPWSLPDNHLVSVTNRFNEIWVGMNRGNGFTRYESEKDRFFHFNPRSNDTSNKDFGTINSINTADGNNFLLGTHGGGIYLWDRKSNSYRHFDENDGLDGIFINSVLPDQNGNYWISTSNGINYFDLKSQQFSRINIDFAFSTNALNGNGVVGPGGHLFMFCKNKLIDIEPGLYHFSDSGAHTMISSFKVFEKELPAALGENIIHLSHRQNFFSFEYSVLKSNPASEARYEYKLEGFDNNWNYAGTRRYAAYTNVPAGSYHFQVRSVNEKGVGSSDITSIRIIISPPFWKTWWFYTLSGLCLCALLYLIYSYRINQLKKLMAMRARISQDLHDEVGSTLSSIHVYSSVASKTMEKDPIQARAALTHIDENTRRVMENMSDIVWAINTGKIGDIALEAKLKNYGYELLTPLNIECSYHVDKEAEKKLVNLEARKNILLIVKEAMNNIAKYSKASRATVHLEFNDRNLRLKISDNGKGFDESAKNSGNGLYNMQKRAEALGGRFSIESGKSSGTTIACIIPITNISE